jgi:hypothetical protein
LSALKGSHSHEKSEKRAMLESRQKCVKKKHNFRINSECVNSLIDCMISGQLLDQNYEISGQLLNQSYEIFGKLLKDFHHNFHKIYRYWTL